MATYIFQKIAKKAHDKKIDALSLDQARRWYRETALSISRVDKTKIIKDKKNSINMVTASDIGSMVLFYYDPKHRETLPFFDIFPLVFPIEMYSDGFLGINLHYLPPAARAHLMDALYTLLSDKVIDNKTRLKLSYKILKSSSRFKLFAPCVKRYLYSHVRSSTLKVETKLWDFALLLPLERFVSNNQKRINKNKVWADVKL